MALAQMTAAYAVVQIHEDGGGALVLAAGPDASDSFRPFGASSTGRSIRTVADLLDRFPDLAILDPWISADAGLTPAAPSQLGGLTAGLLGSDTPIPLPSVPAGREPLLHSLQAYARMQGIEPLPATALRAAIAGLELTPAGERALAQLVLSYCEAVELQRAALIDLSPDELALLLGDPDARARWFHERPQASSDDFERAGIRLARAKIDLGLSLRAADLLTRAIDAARVPLAELPATEDPASVDASPLVPVATVVPPPMSHTLDAGPREPVDLIETLLATIAPPGRSELPPINPGMRLDDALRRLATATGRDSAAVPQIRLPPSLDHALARLVWAEIVGAETQDASLQARTFLQAVRDVKPTLDAWAELLRLMQRPTVFPATRDHLADGLQALLLSPTSPSAVATGARGTTNPTGLPTFRDLSQELERRGMDHGVAQAAEAGLAPQVASMLANVLAAQRELAEAQQGLLDSLDPQEQLAVLLLGAAQESFQKPSWDAADAAIIGAWARGWSTIDPSFFEELEQAQAAAIAGLESATDLLAPRPQPAERNPPAQPSTPAQPVPGGPTAPRAPPAPTPSPVDLPGVIGICPEGSGFSDCKNDIWFEDATNGGILVTGPGSTRIDRTFAGGDPAIIIDLGGDDEYFVSAGTGTGMPQPTYVATDAANLTVWLAGSGGSPDATLAIVENLSATALSAHRMGFAFDLDGNDRYQSSHAHAQGAAVGLGAVGLLWDHAGDDTYEFRPDPGLFSTKVGQGGAGDGGLAILFDGGGRDEYFSPMAAAQGTAVNAGFDLAFLTDPDAVLASDLPHTNLIPTLGGLGILMDIGDGDDAFLSKAGQGSGGGQGTVGILFNDDGDDDYVSTQPGRPAHQGGASGLGSLGLLVDLGGLDGYSNHALFATRAVVPPTSGEEPRKANDVIWLHAEVGALGLGIDASLGDEDHDGYPNLVEAAAGSDPHDASSSPSPLGTLEATIARVQQLVEDLQSADTSDADEDGFPAFVEEAAESDPDDASSTPTTLDNDTLITVPQCLNLGGSLRAGCVSLLTVTGVGTTNVTIPSLVLVDLGGSDNYHARVAGTDILVGSDQNPTFTVGELALELGGDDNYLTPELDHTLGAARFGGASILLDLQGNDEYQAHDDSQGSARGLNGGLGLLIDAAGNDEYVAHARSQGFAVSGSVGALLDLGGADHYRADTQAFGRGISAGADIQNTGAFEPRSEGAALLFDGGGVDNYTSATTDPRLRLNESDAWSLFATQGRAIEDDRYFGSAHFIELGPEDDQYWLTGMDGALVEVSLRKNDVADVRGFGSEVLGTNLWNVNVVNGVLTFSDNPGGLNEDPDGDGTSTLVELLTGTHPSNGTHDAGPGADALSQAMRSPLMPAEDPGLDTQGPWLDASKPGGDGLAALLEPGRLGLPGLIIGGRGDGVYETNVAFLVDLGGNDTYTAPFAAGIAPPVNGFYRGDSMVPVAGAPQNPNAEAYIGANAPTSVALSLDITPRGWSPTVDVYAPRECNVTRDVFNAPAAAYEGRAASKPGFALVGPQPSPPLVLCPSLGGAVAGIAILADDGGTNSFQTSLRVSFNSTGTVSSAATLAYGVTQGAGYLGGVGILATWNSTNSFDVTVAAQAREVHADASASHARAAARGLAQGAGWAGIGILAAFDAGDDDYAVDTSATGNSADPNPYQAADLAQGAAQDGIGILLDWGGRNSFHAPHGYAQGYAAGAMDSFTTGSARSQTKPLASSLVDPHHPLSLPLTSQQQTPDASASYLGMLWSGTGDDTYVGEIFSQGASAGSWGPLLSSAAVDSAIASHSVGVLLDGGGQDVYSIPRTAAAPPRLSCPIRGGPAADPYNPTTECATSQGAGAFEGTGLLLDWSGDDQYLAESRTSVQGVSAVGNGILLDLGGNDVYHARSHAQGIALHERANGQAAQPPQHMGLLADFQGSDYYGARSHAQGSVHPITTGGNEPSLLGMFMDGQGVDTYDYPATGVNPKRPFQNVGAVPAKPSQNDWVWDQPAVNRRNNDVSIGIDSDRLSDALLALQSQLAPIVEDSTDIQVFASRFSDDLTGAKRLQPLEFGRGVLYLFARYNPPATQPADNVRRVDFQLNGRSVGAGELVSEAAGPRPLVYRFTWDTRPATDTHDAQAFPDGNYSLRATLFLDQTKPGGLGMAWGPASAPDTVSATSPPFGLRLDNPPVVFANLSRSAVSTRSGADPIELHLAMSADYPDSSVPHGQVSLRMAPAGPTGPTRTYPPQSVFDGGIDVEIDGRCPPEPCPDGPYLLHTSFVDANGNTPAQAPPPIPFIIDGTAPVADLGLGAFANATHRIGTNKLLVEWDATDDRHGLGTASVSGVDHVDVLRIGEAGEVIEVLGSFGPDNRSKELGGVREGQQLRLIVVATDVLGNKESPCLQLPDGSIESEPCFLRKFQAGRSIGTMIDFIPPELNPCRPSPDGVPICEPGPRIARPGEPVVFEVRSGDPGSPAAPASGLDSVRIEFDDGTSFEMEHAGGGRFLFEDWGDSNQDKSADEEPYGYTITARDLAGNARSRSFVGYLDALAPRIESPTVTYRSDNQDFPMGKPGSFATVRARISDLAGGRLDVHLNASAAEGDARVNCGQDPAVVDGSVWACVFQLSDGLEDDAAYSVALNATDEVDNTNQIVLPIQLSSVPPRIEGVRIVAAGHDNFTVEWNTSIPATGQVLYGLTSSQLTESALVRTLETQHRIEVRGLAPSRNYFVIVRSVAENGASNNSLPIRALTTSAYQLEVDGLSANQSVSGALALTMRANSFISNPSPVEASIFLQDATGRTSPVRVQDLSLGAQPAQVMVDTSGFADGTYVLLLQATRLGDRQEFTSAPFHIDNAVPTLTLLRPGAGAYINETRPEIQIRVDDAEAAVEPSPDGITLRVDGSPTLLGSPDYRPVLYVPGAANLSFTVAEALDDGPHEILVQVSDAAGNTAELNWTLHVDTRAPSRMSEAVVGYDPGPSAGRPGGRVNVSLSLADSTGVAGAWVDLTSVGGPVSPLSSAGTSAPWTGQALLPSRIASPVLQAPVFASDRAGNTVRVALLNLTIDAVTPQLTGLRLTPIGFARADINVSVSEPARIVVRLDGNATEPNSTVGREHRVSIAGLRPGRSYVVEVEAVDGAGNTNRSFAALRMPIDDSPPQAPNDAQGVSKQEGVATLTWSSGSDNAGIDSYLVERMGPELQPVWSVLVPSDQTRAVDASAPAGRDALYEIRSVDVAGLTSEPVQVLVPIHAAPHLAAAVAEPMMGPAERPFLLKVTYKHAAGRAPDEVVAMVGTEAIAMRLASAPGCEFQCAYEVEVYLEPTPLRGTPEPIVFHARLGDDTAVLPMTQLPLVLADPGQGGDAPAVGPVAMLVLVFAALLQRRRRSP